MNIQVGKVDEWIKVCTTCRQKAPPIHECVLPTDKHGSRPQYFDLCQSCIAMVQALPDEYMTFETPLHLRLFPWRIQRGERGGGAKSGRIRAGSMRLTVMTVVDRGLPPGERACDGYRLRGEALREVRIPYSGDGGYYRDLCPHCIQMLQQMPALPAMKGSHDKMKVDTAWERALLRLRESGQAP